MTTFNEISFQTIRNYEEFLARDIHFLSHEDEYFQHVFEISAYTAMKPDSLHLQSNPSELDQPSQATSRDVTMILAISAICAGSFGLTVLLLYLVFIFRSV